MIKSVLVALTLATASVGGASAGSRTINVWGAQLDAPGEQVEAPAFASRMSDRGSSRFMALTAAPSSEPAPVSNGYRQVEHAR